MLGNLWLLAAAIAIDRMVGDPKWMWKHTGHPVVWMGNLIAVSDRGLNDPRDADILRYRKGALAVAIWIAAALIAAYVLAGISNWPGGFIFELFVIYVYIAGGSLREHVMAVAQALAQEGLAAGRRQVAMIVGRDPEQLDRSGVCRAAIESLAENFNDGVVAPAFWYAALGLPGLLAYKMINTADSMVGHRDERYLWFGRVAAQIDDLANWLPARLSVLLIAIGASAARGWEAGRQAVSISLRDGRLHASPNAGLPEAAMAGACDIALGGTRFYDQKAVLQPFINAAGKLDLDGNDIRAAIVVFDGALAVLTVATLLLALALS